MMFNRSPSPIVRLAVLPALMLALHGCDGPEPLEEPLSDEAMSAVSEDAGAPRKEVARQVDDLFTKDGQGETRALVVYANGELAAERYADGYDAETRFVSWSMAKTVTAVMIGMLVADGRLSLDEPAPIPLWQRPGDPRGAITLRHLLQMRSGLRHTETGDPPWESSEVRMLFLDGRDDMAHWAMEQPLEAEPGEQFEYSTSTTVILADIAARALTRSTKPDDRRRAVADYLDSRLFEPLGMASIVPEFDAAGTLIGGSLMHATARDWARFGEMLRRKGRAPTGEQLVPARWVEAMTTPSPKSPHYGFQTWLNRKQSNPKPGEVHPLFADRGPETLFYLSGHMGQYVVVSPSQRVTIVRLGHSDAEQRAVMIPELADILDLYPQR